MLVTTNLLKKPFTHITLAVSKESLSSEKDRRYPLQYNSKGP